MTRDPAPGWYRDPAGQAEKRWWDGARWTDRTRGGPPFGASAAAGSAARRRGRVVVAALVGLVVVGAAALGVAGLRGGDESGHLERADALGGSGATLPRVADDDRGMVVVERDQVTVGAGDTTVAAGGASLLIPAGVVPEGTRAVATAYRLEADDPRQQLRQTSAVGPVQFTVDAELAGTVTVSFPVEGDGAVTIISADDGSRLWSPEPTVIRDGMAVAEVNHLSWFDAVRGSWQTASGQLAEAGSWVSYTVADLAFGSRADPPRCDGPWPGWLRDINVVDDRNAPLAACGSAASSAIDEPLRLRLAANRGYAMTVDLPEGTQIPPPGTLDVGQAIALALHGASGGQVVIPATSTVEVLIPPPPAGTTTIDITATTNQWSLAGDAIWALLKELDLPASETAGVYDCVATSLERAVATASRGGTSSLLRSVSRTMRACTSQTAQVVGGQLRPGAERFLAKLAVADLTHSTFEALTDWAADARLVQLFIETSVWSDLHVPVADDALAGMSFALPGTSWTFAPRLSHRDPLEGVLDADGPHQEMTYWLHGEIDVRAGIDGVLAEQSAMYDEFGYEVPDPWYDTVQVAGAERAVRYAYGSPSGDLMVHVLLLDIRDVTVQLTLSGYIESLDLLSSEEVEAFFDSVRVDPEVFVRALAGGQAGP